MAEINEAKHYFLEIYTIDPGESGRYTYLKYTGIRTRMFLVATRDERIYSIYRFLSYARE